MNIFIQFYFLGGWGQTEDVFDIFKVQFLRIISQTLFQQGQGIAHAAFSESRNLFNGFFLIGDLFLIQNLHRSSFDLIEIDLGEVVALTSW